MKNVLLVEDSPMFGKLAKKKIETSFDVPVYWAKSREETERLLEQAGGDFSVALLDYNLPDAPHGEVIDLVLAKGITSFVFTANVTEEVRNYVWSKKVADYIIKDDPNSLDYIISAMGQVDENQNTLILVVDDSRSARTLISELLYVRKYRVINASDGEAALQIMEKYPEIKLVITDYNMPKMNGFQLCQQIRARYGTESKAIIGFSSERTKSTGAQFIKSGANDFVVKQAFLVEEFYSRVERCIETIDLFEKLQKAATCDFLTGLYNRRYFFDFGERLRVEKQNSEQPLACTVLDIDYFKKINDEYGHDVGDDALRGFSKILEENASEYELLARIGGEEFCMLTPDLDLSGIVDRFEVLRIQIEETPVATLPDGTPLHVTASMGICAVVGENIDQMLKIADDKLYEAKKSGRNCVRF